MASESMSTESAELLPNPMSEEVSGDLTDGQLLGSFREGRGRSAEAAFGALIVRHGPMVLRVCRRILGDSDDAADAFQATFLILVRKAGSIRKRDSVASWLHGVARRVALGAKTDTALRRMKERRRAEMTVEAVRDPAEAPSELHEEIDALPVRFREPVVLCYLEGVTTEVAARRLGCPKGTVLSRLARAKERLRLRLTRRGLAMPTVLLGEGFAPAPSAFPAALGDATAHAAMRFAAGETAASAAAAALVHVTIRAMFAAKLKLAASLLTVGVAVGVAVGTAWGVHRFLDRPRPAAAAGPKPEHAVEEAVEETVETGDDETMQRVTALKQIGLALLSDDGGRLPTSAIRGADGTPLLSWRVAILPLLGQAGLFRQFKLDEPWDGPHNKALISRMPHVYASDGGAAGAEGSTTYRAFVGPGTAFEGDRGIAVAEITDGPSNTLMVAEAGEPIPWTKPDELPYAPDKPVPRLGGLPRGGFLGLFCNGEVRFVKGSVSQANRRALITRSGGERLGPADVGEPIR